MTAALRRVAAALPDGEDRPGQADDGRRRRRRHRRPARTSSSRPAPGTGKTLGLPGARRCCRAGGRSWPPPPRRCRSSWSTTTCRSWPTHLGVPFTAALLKGRSNYLCRAALADAVAGADAGHAARRRRGPTRGAAGRDRRRGRPTRRPATGPTCRSPSSNAEWSARVGRRRRVPGRGPLRATATSASPRTPGTRRPRPTSSSSTPTSTALHLASGGAVLPEHDVLVVDEAHALEDVAADTLGRPARARAGSSTWPARCRGRCSPPTTRPPPPLDAAGVRLGARARAARRPAGRSVGTATSAVAARRLRRGGRRRRRARPARSTSAATSPAGEERLARSWPTGLGRRRRRARRARRAAGGVGRGRRRAGRCGSRRSTSAPSWPSRLFADGHGRAHQRHARRRRQLRARRRAARPRPRRAHVATASTSAARSTTRTRRSSTAPPTCPTRAPTAYEAAMLDELEALDRRRRRSHAGAVHQPAGDGGGRRRASRDRLPVRRCSCRTSCPGRILQRALPRRRDVGAARHHGVLAGLRRARAAPARSS